ncbi:MAG: hypothetical protein ACRDHO_10215, partial [Actinomycetota bacterium]
MPRPTARGILRRADQARLPGGYLGRSIYQRGKRADDGRAVMAGRYRRRARRLWDYWRSEQRTLRQGFVALLLGTLTALVAGITLASITDTLQE